MRLGVLVVACGSAVAGCSALVDLDGLHGVADGGLDAATDASFDGASDAPTDAAPDARVDAGFAFFDDFNRADSNQIGNGWYTKSLAFEIGNDALRRVDPDTSIGYLDNLIYRPETFLDVSVSVEVRYGNFSNLPYPQIHVRIDPTTAPIPAELDSYLFFPTAGGTTGMSIARQHGSLAEVIIGSFAVNPPLDTTHVYRFTFSATGTSPVTLVGEVDVQNGATWSSIGTGGAVDTDATRLVTAGSVGLSASNGEQPGDYTYDDFGVTAL